MKTILLLIGSNIFMTLAWYGHLRYKGWPLAWVILISWLIALPEYTLQVPANRWGHATFTAPQLKIIQEVISIGVFIIFCLIYLKEPIRWNYVASFACILGAVAFAFVR
jgi:uncharacterized protein